MLRRLRLRQRNKQKENQVACLFLLRIARERGRRGEGGGNIQIHCRTPQKKQRTAHSSGGGTRARNTTAASSDTGDCHPHASQSDNEKRAAERANRRRNRRRGRQTRTSRAVDQSPDTNNFRKERGGMQEQGSADEKQSKPRRVEIEHTITLGRQNDQETQKEWGRTTSQTGLKGLLELDQRSLARTVL